MSDAPKYRLEKVTDFLAVPQDRLEVCLLEFRDYLALVRGLVDMADEANEALGRHVALLEIGPFEWIDDGMRDRTL